MLFSRSLLNYISHYCYNLSLCQSNTHQTTFSLHVNNRCFPPSLTEEFTKGDNFITCSLIFKIGYLVNYSKSNKFLWNNGKQNNFDLYKQIKNIIYPLYQTYSYSEVGYIKVKVFTLFKKPTGIPPKNHMVNKIMVFMDSYNCLLFKDNKSTWIFCVHWYYVRGCKSFILYSILAYWGELKIDLGIS